MKIRWIRLTVLAALAVTAWHERRAYTLSYALAVADALVHRQAAVIAVAAGTVAVSAWLAAGLARRRPQ